MRKRTVSSIRRETCYVGALGLAKNKMLCGWLGQGRAQLARPPPCPCPARLPSGQGGQWAGGVVQRASGERI